MDEETIIPQLSEAVDAGDIATARDLLTRHLDFLKREDWLSYFLRYAARKDKLDMVSLLVALGADINAPDGGGSPPRHYPGWGCQRPVSCPRSVARARLTEVRPS